MPPDWMNRCLSGHLLYSSSLADDDLLPEIGNGHLATVMQSEAIYAAGLFNGDAHGAAGATTHRARIPRSALWIESVHDDAQQGCGYALDMEKAMFLERKVDPVGAMGVRVEERWYAPLQAPTLLVHEIQLENAGAAEASVAIHQVHRRESEDLALHEIPPVRLLDAGLPVDGSVYAMEGSTRLAEAGNLTTLAMAENVLPSEVKVGAGARRLFFSIVVIVTSLQAAAPSEEALRTLARYVKDDFKEAEGLRGGHEAKWRERLELGRIEVEGDLALAQAVNASLYFLRSSVSAERQEGVSPGGLSSNCYLGHTFWDQETWLWPPFLMLEPEAAEALLQYRVRRREEAARKALACGSGEETSWCPAGYKGRLAEGALMFPWESAHSGQEVQFTRGKLGQWGRFEQHISGDIALALRQYWYATQDRAWLRSTGLPLAKGIAAFYAARVQERGEGIYDLNMVMGPDEYTWPVNNSAYSNAVARAALDFASEASSELGLACGECEDFGRKAAGLAVPTVPWGARGPYHPEHGNFDLEGASAGVKVKQADAILLAYPLGLNFSEAVLRNDLEAYGNITDEHGPAMTWSMFAVGWLQLGDAARSSSNFRRGYANAQLPFQVWSEFPKGKGFPGCVNFITGAGGFLQALLFGLQGMRVERDALRFRPAPPRAAGTAAGRLAFHSLHWRGRRLRVEVGEEAASYELLEGGPVCLGAERRLTLNRPVSLPLQEVLLQECAAAVSTTTATTTSPASSTRAAPVASAGTTAAVASTTAANATAAKPQLTVIALVENVNHDLLVASGDLLLSFKSFLMEELALAAGNEVKPQDVATTLGVGSVKATSVITVPSQDVAKAARVSLNSRPETLARSIAQGVSRLHGIQDVCSGHVWVSDLYVVLNQTASSAAATAANAETGQVLSSLLACLLGMLLVLLGMCFACKRSCSSSAPSSKNGYAAFNGTWERKSAGPLDTRGAFMVIVGDKVTRHGCKKGRIMQTHENGFQIVDSLEEDDESSTQSRTIEMAGNGDLVIGGEERFSRWRKMGKDADYPLLCC